jgi:type II restriction/modification system DNA methylase subunit YeeA
MDKNAIQKFAVWARQELLKQVSQRAFLFGFTKEASDPADATSIRGRLLSQEERTQRQELAALIALRGFDQVIDEVAYTWFNRFIALRFMEVNDYLPSHIRVFTDANGNFKPELLSEALHLDLHGLDPEKVRALLSENRDEDLYRYLLLTQCNALHDILPRMFETMGSYTELLLPDNILHQDSILARLVADIPTEDWQDQVQIIGWLYQFYISEKKDETYDLLSKNVKLTKDTIPSVTQLFTPDWIVRYMVQNSLGRLWTEGHPDHDSLKANWTYYLEEAEQAPEVAQQLAELRTSYAQLKPEEIRFIDPCMGSGHILVYAFDLLIEIYRANGYSDRDAVPLILSNNLYGLDIDDRCSQLAYFAVMMRARYYDRRFFSRLQNGTELHPHLYSLQESNTLADRLQQDQNGLGSQWQSLLPEPEHQETFLYLLDIFRDAKELGSIISVQPRNYSAFLSAWDTAEQQTHTSLPLEAWYKEAAPLIHALASQAIAMSQQYDVVVTNPPYMGSSSMGPTLANFVKKNFPDSKSDLCTVFMEHGIDLLTPHGISSMVTMQSWMFLSGLENMRVKLLRQNTLLALMHMENMVMGIAFGTAVSIFRKEHIHYKATFNHIKYPDIINGEPFTFPVPENRFSQVYTDNFTCIPGSPIAYWMSDSFRQIFTESESLKNVSNSKVGLQTGDNNRFLRQWYEISSEGLGLGIVSCAEAMQSGKKWFPYNKGGEFRKWYGNMDYVVNWENDGEEIRNFKDDKGKLRSRPQNTQFYFRESVSWSYITSGCNAFRFYPQGFVFDVAGMSALGGDTSWKLKALAYSNTPFVSFLTKVINPTINFSNGAYDKLPYAEKFWSEETESSARQLVAIAKEDWDSYETSWEFATSPLLSPDFKSASIADSYSALRRHQLAQIEEMQQLEESNNIRFNTLYGLEDEIDPKVPLEQITLTCNPAYRYGGDKSDEEKEEQFKTDTVKELISYAVGCLFGRYSLDEPGLILANQGDGLAEYSAKVPTPTITPVEDNIIAISDDEHAEGDLVSLFINWLRQAFGPEQLEANLNFIAEALGGKGIAREIIRSYFLSGFYVDHMKRYQKRPIYWLFDSGKKNGFKALMYLHRYTPDLIARLRTDYVHVQQNRLRNRLTTIEEDKADASNSQKSGLAKEEKKLREQERELNAFEEQVHHLADRNISIDLDDGVEANYERFQSILAKRK